jgi:acyl-coenzyme A thioesterase PaaI-like protein
MPSSDSPVTDPETVARTRIGVAMRELGHAVVGHDADPARLNELAGTLEAMTASLAAGSARSRSTAVTHYLHDRPVGEGELLLSHGDRPFAGPFSPWSVDMEVRREGDEAVGRVTFREAHEGAPRRCHGGVVAGVFDDVLGYVLQVHQLMAFTGTLSVRYEQPTPLFTPMVFRARLVRQEGRKLFMAADSWDGDRKIASAEAVFIVTDPSKFVDASPKD